jgi:hypothetical protein
MDLMASWGSLVMSENQIPKNPIERPTDFFSQILGLDSSLHTKETLCFYLPIHLHIPKQVAHR